MENRLFGVSARFELSGVDSVTGIPIPVRTFIPKCRPDFALKSRIRIRASAVGSGKGVNLFSRTNAR